MRVAITGSEGWLGNYVANYLSKDHEITRIDKPALAYAKKGVMGWNICNHGLNLPYVDIVLHFAASANVNVVHENPVEAIESNIVGTANVLEWVKKKKIPDFYYMSSAWCEGWPQNAHPYTMSKLAGEMVCQSWSATYSISTCIVRLGTLYGPGARSGTALCNFVGKALKGEPITIFGEGTPTRCYLYINDLALACEKLVNRHIPLKDEILDICGDEDISVKELADLVRQNIGDVSVIHKEKRKGDLQNELAPAYKLTQALLNWKPEIKIKEGIKLYAAWLRTQENR